MVQRIGGAAAILWGLWRIILGLGVDVRVLFVEIGIGRWFQGFMDLIAVLSVLGLVGLWSAARPGLGSWGHGGFVLLLLGIATDSLIEIWADLFFGLSRLRGDDPFLALGVGLTLALLMVSFDLARSGVMPRLALAGIWGFVILAWTFPMSWTIGEPGAPPAIVVAARDLLLGAGVVWMGWVALRRS